MQRKDHWCRCRGGGCEGGRGMKRGRGRPSFHRKITRIPKSKKLIPIETGEILFEESSEKFKTSNPPVFLYLDELEAIRLVDSEGMSQDQAGVSMNISRGSVWRLLQSGRKKLIEAIFNKNEIRICNCQL